MNSFEMRCPHLLILNDLDSIVEIRKKNSQWLRVQSRAIEGLYCTGLWEGKG